MFCICQFSGSEKYCLADVCFSLAIFAEFTWEVLGLYLRTVPLRNASCSPVKERTGHTCNLFHIIYSFYINVDLQAYILVFSIVTIFLMVNINGLSFSPSLPALDWQLPSCSGPYNLQIEVQPKSHHRAHYETEGSRGAVKALSGGHPVVQVCPRQKPNYLSHYRHFFFFYMSQGYVCVFNFCINFLSLQKKW